MKNLEILKAQEKVIALFHRAYATCPAYKQFIDSHVVNPDSITRPSDIKKIPIMDKDNYLHVYSLTEKLIDNASLADFYMISASSGSTGSPTFWPRSYQIDRDLEKRKAELYQQHFDINHKKTLIIITFALGMWTAGMLTARLTWASAEGKKVSVITPGMNRENVLRAMQELSEQYEQIIILGYPPFLLNLFHYLEDKQYDIPQDKIKVMYTAENLSLRAREYLASKVSTSPDFRNVVGFYASSEAGILASETPDLATFSQSTYANSELNSLLFDTTLPGTLYGFNPLAKYIEVYDGELLITSDQPIPLIRYNIHDRGKILSRQMLIDAASRYNLSFENKDIPEWMVAVYGRSNSVVLTANIYIEDIKYCLEHSKFYASLSGRFQFGVKETDRLKKQLEVVVYLKPGKTLTADEQAEFRDEFTSMLFDTNADLSSLKHDQEYLSSVEPINIMFKELDSYEITTVKLQYFL